MFWIGLWSAAAVPLYQGSVWVDEDTGSVTVRPTVNATACASGYFDDALNSTGWGVLDIRTQLAGDHWQYFCAGYLEGYLTARRIKEAIINHRAYFSQGSTFPSPGLLKFVQVQQQWIKEQIDAHPDDLFWTTVSLLMWQFKGLLQGSTSVDSSITEFDLYTLSSVGDFFQVIPAVDREKFPNWWNMTSEEFFTTCRRYQMCSAIIKVADDYSDLLWGHSSWFTYMAMNRIYKHFYFNVSLPLAAKGVTFSSYPGYLVSLDDFYLMDNGLSMIQTSNNIFDDSLLDLVKPQSLLAWQRVRVANSLSHTGSQWYSYFSRAASGTYVNQYMVLNFGLFTPGQPLKADTLWVVEEIPGLVYGGDVTSYLERGYWPSYNCPFWPKVYNASGYPAAEAKYGPEISYDLSPRAKMFRRDQSKVTNIDGLKRLLRQNDYKTDPLAEGDPHKAICSRGDLAASHSTGGCYDTKATQLSLAKQRSSWAINGPTYQNLPPFAWTSEFANTTHIGQPTTFNFPFVLMTPRQ